MPTQTFDDEDVQAALRAFVLACDALDGATLDADVLNLSDLKAVAGLNLRKSLIDTGWTAPLRQVAEPS